MAKKLYRNMHLFTPVDGGKPLAGAEQARVKEIKKAAMLVSGGIIEKIGEEEEILKNVCPCEVAIEKDFGGACVIPGFVDPHTHMCFAKRREDEFGMRLAGLHYLEILKRGGGILSSVNAVKAATEDQLFETTKKLALAALAKGTTTVEIKSGYGLELGLELKMLEVIGRVGRETPLDVVPTFMGAHAVPQEYKGRADEFVDEVLVKQMLPKVKEQGIAEFCDVFCEEGVFSVDQSRRLLKAAKEMGFDTKIHADEVNDLGGAGLAAELATRSAEHLLAASEANLRAMGKAGSIAVLLPATAYSLKKPYARGREMVDWGRARRDGDGLQPRLMLLRIDAVHLRPRRNVHGPLRRRGAHRSDAQRRLRREPREKSSAVSKRANRRTSSYSTAKVRRPSPTTPERPQSKKSTNSASA